MDGWYYVRTVRVDNHDEFQIAHSEERPSRSFGSFLDREFAQREAERMNEDSKASSDALKNAVGKLFKGGKSV